MVCKFMTYSYDYVPDHHISIQDHCVKHIQLDVCSCLQITPCAIKGEEEAEHSLEILKEQH